MNKTMNFEDVNVDIIQGEDGKPLFELYSVGIALGFSRANGAGVFYPRKDRIDNCARNAEISTSVHDGHTYITEEQLYDFMLEARTEKCKSFRKWITHEVLPAVREDGGYMVAKENETDEDLIARALVVAHKTIARREKELAEAKRRNAVLMHVTKTYTATEIAKELGFKSAIALNTDLCNRKIQYKSNGTYVLYSQYADLGYTSIKQTVLDSGKVVYDRKFTQDGRKFLIDVYNKQDELEI